VPSLLLMVPVALAGHVMSNSADVRSLLLMVPVALPGRVVSNSTHLPSLLLTTCPPRATKAISNNEGKWAEVLMMCSRYCAPPPVCLHHCFACRWHLRGAS